MAGNSNKILAQMTLNATTVSVMLNNLTTGATYNIVIVAYTRVGAGPLSQPVSIYVLYGNLYNYKNCICFYYYNSIQLMMSFINCRFVVEKK